MTVKQFFKSTAFKCIVVLLSILLICGVFLTVMNGLLEVTDEERFARAVQKIYGKSVETEEISLDGEKTSFDYAEISEAYKVKDDGNYLVKVSGKEGYGGAVVCWVVVDMSDDGKEIDGVMKIAIDSAPGESYISKISQGALDALAAKAEYGKEVMGGFAHGSKEHGGDYIATGASYSMRAISNCMNGAMDFVAAYALGVAKSDFYTDNGFEYLEMINKQETSYAVESGVVTYNITTQGYSPTTAFKLTIVVSKTGNDATITSVSVTQSGSVQGQGKTAEEFDALTKTDYAGKTLAYFTDMLGTDMAYPGDNAGKDISTGASKSSYNVAYACAFALANYQKAVSTPYTGGDAQ